MWFSVVFVFIDNETRHHSGQNVVDSRGAPHFDFSYNINVKEFFFTERAEKSVVSHINASSVVWTLIDNGKLTNQIARLVAIVVKKLVFRNWWLNVKTISFS